MTCPACSSVVREIDRFCSSCGAVLTRTSHLPSPAHAGESQETPARSSERELPGDLNGEPRLDTGVLVSGRYRILELIGEGGMGRVYRAEDLELQQTVALKFLTESLGRDDARRERFRREVRIARQVTHPNVCRVHDIGQLGRWHYLSMEYVDGEDLGSELLC